MKKKFFDIFLACIISASIFINIDLFTNLVEMDFSTFYDINTLGMSLLAIFIAVLFSKKDRKKVLKSKKVLSYFFTFSMIIGECYISAGTYKLIFTNSVTVLITLMKIIGYKTLFEYLFNILDGLLQLKDKGDIKPKGKCMKGFIEFFKKHPFLVSFVSILIVWSIYMYAYYPIVLSPDPSNQIKQFFGVHTSYMDWVILRDPNVTITAHHPILQTYLLGWAITLGRNIMNDNFGLFIYTVGQTLIYSSILAYSIKFAYRNGLKVKHCLMILGMYLFVPMYAFYSVSAVKDTLYTAFMLLFTLFIFDLIKNYQEKKISILYSIYLFIVMTLVGLFRHNGLYVIVMTLPFMLLINKKNIIRIVIPFIAFFGCMMMVDKVIIPALGIADGSIREMLSIPFQQTARVALERDEYYSKSDKKIINKVLTYKSLASRYKPELSDPVKNKYNKNATNKDLKKYFKVWAKGLIPNFDIYVDATLNNTYGYIYPNAHKWYVYSKFDTRVTDDNLIDYHYIDSRKELRNGLNMYANVFPFIPFIGLLSNMAIGTWVTLILLVYLFSTKNKKYAISLVPLFATILFCIVGPANTYFRYTMPYMFALPVLTMLLLKVIRGVKNEEK